MIFFNRIALINGIDVRIGETWYGVHYSWQCSPMFSTVYSHRKGNTLHTYGIIVFGLWLYVTIDE